jgi:hypothetical protein
MSEKELHYFSNERFYGPPLYERDESWYLSRFDNPQDKSLLGEASVWYLSSDIAAHRIKQFCPSAKILIHVRNPVELLVSYHSELLFLGYEDIYDIERALDLEQRRRKGLNIPTECPVPRVLYYREIASLSHQIERFIDVFGRHNIHINIFDDFISDPATVYRNTLAFLEVNSSFTTTFEVINSNKIIRYRWMRTLLDHPPEQLRQVAKLLLSELMRETIRGWFWRISTRFAPRTTPDPSVITRLTRDFTGEFERLRDLLGRDLTLSSSSGSIVNI